jgi:uncharacterized Zn finger protein (UPF0148 family)
MKSDYSRSLTLVCSVCGNSSFDFDTADGSILCATCERIYPSKDDLIAENGTRVDHGMDEMKNEVVKDIKKTFSKLFKK